MQKVLLKKIIMTPEVSFTGEYDENGKPIDKVVEDGEVVEREIFGLFDVGRVSIREIPIGGRFYDSIEDLNKALGTSFTKKDIGLFDKVLEEKSTAWKKILEKVNH